MKKTKILSYLIVGLVIVLGLVGNAGQANAAYNTIIFSTDTNIAISSLGINVVMKAGSQVAGMIVYADHISLDLEKGSLVSMTGPANYNLTTPLSKTTCGASVSSMGFGALSSATVTVTPESPCQGGGGVGGSTAPSAAAPASSPAPAASAPASSPAPAASAPAVTTPAVTVSKPISQMTPTELAAEITRLTTMLVSLQSQIPGATPAQTVTGGQFSSDLSYGLKNNSNVKQLQNFLISKGYLVAGLNTGSYLMKTVEAVKKYQSAKGITPVNGRFGPKTRAAANAEM